MEQAEASAVIEEAGSASAMPAIVALSVMVVWGGTPLFSKLAAAEIDPLMVGILRTVFAGALAVPLLLAMRHRLPEGRRARYRLGEGITGRVVESGKPIVVPRISREPQFLNLAPRRPDHQKQELTFICVPIVINRLAVGALALAERVAFGTVLTAFFAGAFLAASFFAATFLAAGFFAAGVRLAGSCAAATGATGKPLNSRKDVSKCAANSSTSGMACAQAMMPTSSDSL